ncbi:flagellar biosynthesis protein FlgD [Acetobacteraceae bacterium KSS8]|uniref:Basal-body rod modification protein FlgD n=1 Tax=Endosaccharibacter trunci TaxID=2812733 RepID=A0ABT1W8A7_9PROT|nr:flagellar biosynthesis protein FlgD [Acetobacteraceae bacterium KSS8]
MSSTISSTDLTTAAAAAAKQAHSSNLASSAAASTSASTPDSLSSLTSNYNQFLTLLTAQLQHQDPTSPTDTSSFTSELAQFAGVEEQIKTNTNLSQLIALNQTSEMSQSSSFVGKQAVLSSSQMALQNATGTLQFNLPTAETVGIAVTNSAGAVVANRSADIPAGTSTWTWNGKDDAGNTLPDGTYDVAVVTPNASGGSSAVPFNVIGTITGIAKNANGGVNVQMGSTSADMSEVISLLSPSTPAS